MFVECQSGRKIRQITTEHRTEQKSEEQKKLDFLHISSQLIQYSMAMRWKKKKTN